MARKKQSGTEKFNGQQSLPLKPERTKKLDVSALENWLWEAACTIRGPLDAPKFKDYILPLIFLKRLSDVFDDEVAHLAHDFGDVKTAAKLVEQDHKLVRFYIPQKARWSFIVEKSTGLGELLTDAVRAIARENPRLSGVIDVTDFNATAAGQRMVDDGRLAALVQVLNNPDYRLGLDDVEPDIIGRAYEYLLRKFAEGQGQSAGEFYTPREVAVLMAIILDPQPGMTVDDPCCGSAGLLIKCHLRLLETKGKKTNGRLSLPSSVAPLRLFGQEINSSTFAMARMNAFLHDMEAEIALGDTMHRPAFTEGDGRLRQFDLVTANPMWNQKFPAATYENDPHERFKRGVPPSSSADWGWIQHMAASLKDGGRMAVVLDTGAVSRGSGNQGSNKERDIRKVFVEADLVEAVVLLAREPVLQHDRPGHRPRPEHAEAAQGRDPAHQRLEALLQGATQELPRRGAHQADRPRSTTSGGQRPGSRRSSSTAEAVKNDYNLSPSRYVATGETEEVLPLEEAVVLLQEAEEERAEADRELEAVLRSLASRVGEMARAVDASNQEGQSGIEFDALELPSDWELAPFPIDYPSRTPQDR